mmetsp:Transcript_54544/g.174954  ORF Transcript_54544/g.174954 Transcript_54544/m.174954 type:complete len:135 (-) Transcript_54544:95-499(-)
MRRSRLIVILWAGLLVWCAHWPSTPFVAAPPRGAGCAPAGADRRPARPVSLRARGGARGGEEAVDEGPNAVLVAVGAVFGLYVFFLLNYGWLDCIDGDYSPFQVSKCTVADTLYGADDIWFQVRCKLKLTPACR